MLFRSPHIDDRKLSYFPSGFISTGALNIDMGRNMPDVDGIALCRQIRADPRYKLLPVLFLTASKEDLDLLRSFQAGGSSYLNKPVSGRKLEFTIQQILRSAKTTPAV